MKKLTYLEQKIIAAIAETYPYSFREVEMAYRRCKSFDITIKVIEGSLAHVGGLSRKLSELGY